MPGGIKQPANQILVLGTRLKATLEVETATIELGKLVKYGSTTDKIVKTAAGDFEFIGVADRDLRVAFATGMVVGAFAPVILRNSPAVVICIAGAAITAGVRVETGADGKVVTYAPTAIGDSAAIVGTALEAAAADEDKIMVALGG